MKLHRLAVLLLAVSLASGPAWAEAPIGHPSTGGPLPQDLDTLSAPITASTTQTQAGATLCSNTICYVTTASSGDGIRLRQCTQAPMRVVVINASSNTIKVYGSGTDTINGVLTTTGVSLVKVSTTPGVGVAEYVCVAGGAAAKWLSVAH